MNYIKQNSIISSIELEAWAVNYAGLSAETVRRDARQLVKDKKIDALVKKGSTLAWYKTKDTLLPFGFFIREKNKLKIDDEIYTKQDTFL